MLYVQVGQLAIEWGGTGSKSFQIGLWGSFGFGLIWVWVVSCSGWTVIDSSFFRVKPSSSWFFLFGSDFPALMLIEYTLTRMNELNLVIISLLFFFFYKTLKKKEYWLMKETPINIKHMFERKIAPSQTHNYFGYQKVPIALKLFMVLLNIIYN